MADPVRTKVAIAVSAQATTAVNALAAFNTAIAAAIATATPLATYPVGSNSQSTTVGAPTDPQNLVTVCCPNVTYDGTNYIYTSMVQYIKFV